MHGILREFYLLDDEIATLVKLEAWKKEIRDDSGARLFFAFVRVGYIIFYVACREAARRLISY